MVQITLKDVAKKAGVSFKTVSRVLNNEPNVAAKTSEKVKKAIEDLNYVPNSAARNLSRGRAMTIGLVVGWPVKSPYSSSLIDYTLKESVRNGYRLTLFSMEDGVSDQIVQAFLGKQVDGVILDTNPAEDKDLTCQLNALNVPYVVVHPNIKSDSRKTSFVRIDNVAGAKQAVEYLIQLGHRSIGYISNSLSPSQEDERLDGYRIALSEAGIPFRSEWVFEDDSLPYQAGFTGAMHLIHNYKEITAIFDGTDEIALGTMSALWQLGLKIPDDISVIGFDDIFYASMITPPLTTIHQPIDEISSAAVKQLIQTIDGPGTDPVDIIMPTRLVVRETCKPPHCKD